MYIVLNSMRQRIKHRGQLCKGDKVYRSNGFFMGEVSRINFGKNKARVYYS